MKEYYRFDTPLLAAGSFIDATREFFMTATSHLAPIDVKSGLRYLAYTIVLNTSIAAFLTIIRFGQGFLEHFIFSQLIGLMICVAVMMSMRLFQPQKGWKLHLAILAGILAGTVVGTLLGWVVTDADLSLVSQGSALFFRSLAMGLFFGLAASYLFFMHRKALVADRTSREERINRLMVEKQVAETELRLLQAQIEPHFLFNTLSNVLSLMETRPDHAQTMLADFIHYLRLCLSATRAESNTLGREMELIRAYLNLFQIRMGERLKYQIVMPDDLVETPIAPMLLQPLVENAVKHGVEPMIDGGEICVSAQIRDGSLNLEVADTGAGFIQNRPGVGLGNVKDRLASLYGPNAHLYFKENHPRGLRVVIEVPL